MHTSFSATLGNIPEKVLGRCNMKKYLFYEQEAIGTVPFKVRNLRKTRNFGQKFSIFSANLLTGMVIFGRI